MDKTLDFNITSDYNVSGFVKVTLTLSDGDRNVSKSFNVYVVNRNKIFESGDSWKGLVYKTVTSPYTGRVWLDRNLGAKRVCIKSDDEQCYGDYYQWGRDTYRDKKTNPKKIFTEAISLGYGRDKFIMNSYGIGDWTTLDSDRSIRSTNWSKTDGSSICPVGFRVPTIDELKAETIDLIGYDKVENLADAYNGFLKISGIGFRGNNPSILRGGHMGYNGFLWSATTDGNGAYSINFNIAGVFLIENDFRYNKYPVRRCIKE